MIPLKQATKSHYNTSSLYDIIIMRRKYGTSLMGAIPWGFSYARRR
nr:MAG TPA: hypothetical protein [Caudoviricetes sp.]